MKSFQTAAKARLGMHLQLCSCHTLAFPCYLTAALLQVCRIALCWPLPQGEGARGEPRDEAGSTAHGGWV